MKMSFAAGISNAESDFIASRRATPFDGRRPLVDQVALGLQLTFRGWDQDFAT